MTKTERAQRYRDQISECKAKMNLLEEIGEGISSAAGALEELLAPVGPGQLEIPPGHKRKAQSIIKQLESWSKKLELEQDRLYERQEDVEHKLDDIAESA